MSIAEEIDGFLKDYECEGEQAEWFVDLMKRASKELKALMADGDTLLQVIENKNHNNSLMRSRIADLEKENKELKKELKRGKN